MQCPELRLVPILYTILYVQAILLAAVYACQLRPRHVRCFLFDLLHHVLDPIHSWKVLIYQGLRLEEIRLFVKEPLTEPYLVFLIGHRLGHKVQIGFTFVSGHNLKFEFQISHLAGHLISIPLVYVLLVQPQVVRLGRDVPKGVEEGAEDEADRDQGAARVELHQKPLVLDHRERRALPARRRPL